MLAGVKIIPREELLKHEEENNLTPPKRRKDKHLESFNEDNSLERKERHAKRRRKKTRNGTPSCSDLDGDSDGRDKRSKGQKRRSQREKVGGKKNNESDKNDMPEHNNGSLRKQMGLEWMLKPGNIMHDKPTSEGSDQESQGEQVKKINKKNLIHIFKIMEVGIR
ncbi:hypothetical protein HPP92_017792 [Vanilla planifolia]|uniref:Uncharacterized protein n=1 Tax=Vanilla planifolia TaxID=51239 RepID=A0A835QF48_VANPL|nr:hypothetical protein HPP92_017792 [Vanilla planifolia]